MRIPRQRLPVDKDMDAIGTEGQGESIAEQLFAAAQIFQVTGRIAEAPERGIALMDNDQRPLPAFAVAVDKDVIVDDPVAEEVVKIKSIGAAEEGTSTQQREDGPFVIGDKTRIGDLLMPGADRLSLPLQMRRNLCPLSAPNGLLQPFRLLFPWPPESRQHLPL